MSMPKVTVGMPAFNRAHFLKSSIQQVLDQTFTDFELIIFNDGSTDNTIEILNKIDDPRVEIINSVNVGPPHPLNTILKKARGEFIIILHDNDFFAPNLLQKSLEALEKYPVAGFVLQGSAWIDEDGVSNYREMLHDLPEYNNGFEQAVKMLTDKFNFNTIFHACCMVRRSCHEQAGWYYDEKFGLYADVDLWYRLLLVTDFIYLNEVLIKFRDRELSGHFLDKKVYEIVTWCYNIQVLNIQRFFPDSKHQVELLATTKLKWQKKIKLTVLKYASNNEVSLFHKGLQIIKDFENSSIQNGIIKILSQQQALSLCIVYLLTFINKVRKWLKMG